MATSNLANSVAATLGEELFETKVGFKEFKPVIGKALVYFEESDGISVIGHTPEKDAYIGLLLALVALAGLREKMRYSDIPKGLEGLGITFIQARFRPCESAIEGNILDASIDHEVFGIGAFCHPHLVTISSGKEPSRDGLLGQVPAGSGIGIAASIGIDIDGRSGERLEAGEDNQQ